MKKRVKKTTVRYIYEGQIEKTFLAHLKSLFPESRAREILLRSGKGGGANSLVSGALDEKNNYDKLFLILDEDFAKKDKQHRIQKETLAKLEEAWCIEKETLNNVIYRDLSAKNVKKRNPIIIFSNPSSIEGILLQMLGKSKSELENKETQYLKDMFNGHKRKFDINEFFKKVFTLELIQEKRTIISELDEIVRIFEGDVKYSV